MAPVKKKFRRFKKIKIYIILVKAYRCNFNCKIENGKEKGRDKHINPDAIGNCWQVVEKRGHLEGLNKIKQISQMGHNDEKAKAEKAINT